MIKISEDFECEEETYQWVLHQWVDGKDKDDNPKRQKRTTYHSSLSQICDVVVNRQAGMCDIEYCKGCEPTLYGARSRHCMASAHIDLARILESLALDGWNISVLCGNRSKEAQTIAYDAGYSKLKWPNSDHNVFPSHAVDIAPYIPGVGIPWESHTNLWVILAGAFMSKAQHFNIEVEWGGLYQGLQDLGHFALIGHHRE